MSALAADLPTPVSVECLDVVDRLAQLLEADGDPRPIGELRAEVLADLIRRPWDTSRPAVTAHVHITAALSALAARTAESGDVTGQPITAGHVRELLARIGALGLQTPEGGSLTFALTDADGRLLATATPGQLAHLARRGCATHRDQDCGCPVLGRPEPTDAHDPTAAQDTFLTTRDRACRFPNCGQRVGWTDRDHVIRHADGGATDCANLCCPCRSHHRLKTLARGWRFVMDPDGTLHVTTPSGVTRTTRPPGVRAPAPDPPSMDGDPPPNDDDPPPF